jgi:hypothetical protein
MAIGIVALRRIKRAKVAAEGKGRAKAGVWISSISLVVFCGWICCAVWMAAHIFRRPMFKECDPSSVIALIEKRLEIKFPEKMESVRAAEKELTWLEHTYIFIVNFTTDQDSFEELRRSLPKKDRWYNIREYDPRSNYSFRNIPQWHKRPIREGECYGGSIYSKSKAIQIEAFCTDTSDARNVVVYIEGIGHYHPGYNLDYINPDSAKSVRWLLDRFSENMQVKFPADTTLINVKQLRALYAHAYIKVKIKKRALTEFIRSSPFAGKPLHDEKRLCNNEPDLPWWDPEKPKVFKSGETTLSDIYSLRILIDLDEPKAAVIYLELLEM